MSESAGGASSREGTSTRPRRALALVAALWLLALTPPAAAAAAEAAPDARLRARVEAHLASRRAELELLPYHLGLIDTVDSDRLVRALADVGFERRGDDLALGAAGAPEPHGGGILALLLEHWRPEGRAAGLDDAFLFAPNREALALRHLYDAYRRQLFLPVPGRRAESIAGDLPSSPRLPRMRFPFPSAGGIVETDSYALLGLLIAHESDPTAPWRNHVGQELSVDLLIGHVRDHYLADADRGAELADHTNLHRVALLLAYQRRFPDRLDPEPIRLHFLAHELALGDPKGTSDGTEVLGHRAESLGLLTANPEIRWSPEERQNVDAWLDALDRGPFHELDGIPLQHLCHLLRGLRLVAASWGRLP